MKACHWSNLPPEGFEVISSTFAYEDTYTIDGEFDKYEVRLCPRGCDQIDSYRQTCAPTPQFAVLRLLRILSMRINAQMTQFDITQAFQHPDIDEKIWFTLPTGFSLDGCTYAVANTGLQGIKQAARLWYKAYDTFCLELHSDVRKSESEPCLYGVWTSTGKAAWSIRMDDNFGLSDPPSFFIARMDAAEKMGYYTSEYNVYYPWYVYHSIPTP